MIINRGDIWWADLGMPENSEPGFKRPIVVIQDNSYNESLLSTVVVCSITSNLRLAEIPGNILLTGDVSGLTKDSVINITQISTIDKSWLVEKVGYLDSESSLELSESLKLVLSIY